MRRLFFAAVPSPDVLRRLQAIELPAKAAYGRAVPVAKLHMTILFMARVSASGVSDLLQLMPQLPPPEASINFNKLSYWSGSGVLVLTGPTPANNLRLWRRSLMAEVTRLGVRPDRRLWRPHLTMRRGVSEGCAEVGVAAIEWRLQSFGLFESIEGRYHLLGSQSCQPGE